MPLMTTGGNMAAQPGKPRLAPGGGLPGLGTTGGNMANPGGGTLGGRPGGGMAGVGYRLGGDANADPQLMARRRALTRLLSGGNLRPTPINDPGTGVMLGGPGTGPGGLTGTGGFNLGAKKTQGPAAGAPGLMLNRY